METLRIIFLMTISVSLANNQDGLNVTELLQTIAQLQATVNSLQTTVNSHQTKLDIVETETKYKLNTVESEIVVQANRTTKLGENINYKVSVLRGMSLQSMNELTNVKVNLGAELTNVKVNLGAGRPLFTAYMTRYQYPATGQVVSFPGVELNQGGHYDNSTSKFTCPKRGVYFFTFSLHSAYIRYGSSYYHSTADLVLDGHTVARAYSRNWDPDHNMQFQGSNSAVVECPQGGQVWVKSCCSSNQIYGSSSARETTFSGFLLS